MKEVFGTIKNILKYTKNMNKKIWIIQLPYYGSFIFEGTEIQSEQRRIDKSNWEGEIAKKRLATEDEILAKKPISECWNHPNFNNKFRYNCKCEICLKRKEKLAKRREQYKL